MRDQRLKVACAVIGSVLIAIMQSVESLFGVLILALGIAGLTALPVNRWLAGLDFKVMFRRLLRLNILTVILWLTLGWTLTDSGGFERDAEGMQQALIISLRLNAIALWCLIWLASVHAESLASALRSLGFPVRLALLFYLSIRSLDGLVAGRERLQRAMRARAHPVRFGRRLRITAQLLALMLLEGLQRAETFSAALRMRGLDLQTGGFLLARDSWRDVSWRELLLVLLMLLLLASLGWFGR